ncbi:polyprenyl synthetase family protein [Streptomyces sp. NPDC060188]|uniref:polyprenyl synthetase family protein n=1 Tax=Streptomyces sp. NPDC060188 TaxID=3347068 RepID=UPI00365B8CDF
MRPSKPEGPCAIEAPPGSVHASRREASAAGGPQPPAADQPAPPDQARADRRGLRAVDADVSAAVHGHLDRLLAERTAQATALDPVFARDLAARVARFTLEGGKRTRAQFLWWALRACGGTAGDVGAALRIGAALELIQTCALIHDDVMDGSRLRRGRPAVHADVESQYAGYVSTAQRERFGESAAILAGDLALAWADDILADTDLLPGRGERVRALWSAMRMEMVAGQYLDIQGQTTSSRSLAHAIRAACLKSALYSVERPLALGAALADADDTTTAALCSAGRCVGIAFQLRDDLHDVFGAGQGGKPSGGDIRSGKPTYLVAVAQARAQARDDRRALDVLRDSLGRPGLSKNGLARVQEVLVSTGARATTEAKISKLAAQGMRHLESATLDPAGRDRLRALLWSAAGTPSAPAPVTAGPHPSPTPAPSLLVAAEGIRR